MADIKIFNDDRFGQVRIQMDASGEPLFCASDVCNALGYTNGRDAVSNHVDADDVAKCDTLTKGGTQLMTYVNESGLYSLIFGSKLEAAKDFKKWVTSEVLPSIRKTGQYSVKDNSKQYPQLSIKDKMQAATWAAKFLNLNDNSKLIIAKQILEPYNFQLPDYTPSKGILKSASDLLKERESGISAQVFNNKAIEKGYLCEMERNSSHGQKKKFKSITKKGLPYGENQVHPSNPRSTQPAWYADKFDELFVLLGFSTVND